MRIKNYSIYVFLTVFYTLPGCSETQEQKKTNPLSGLWTLHIMEQQDPETGQWHEWRNGMQGYLLYDDKGNMALHLTEKGYENTPLEFPNFNDSIPVEALKYLTKSYYYMARYSVLNEDSIVAHTRISHSNPGEWGKTVQRRFTFRGDTLVLQPVEDQNSGLRLKWLRIQPGNYNQR